VGLHLFKTVSGINSAGEVHPKTPAWSDENLKLGPQRQCKKPRKGSGFGGAFFQADPDLKSTFLRVVSGLNISSIWGMSTNYLTNNQTF